MGALQRGARGCRGFGIQWIAVGCSGLQWILQRSRPHFHISVASNVSRMRWTQKPVSLTKAIGTARPVDTQRPSRQSNLGYRCITSHLGDASGQPINTTPGTDNVRCAFRLTLGEPAKMPTRGMEHVRYEADGRKPAGAGRAVRLVAGMGGGGGKGQQGFRETRMDAGENLGMAPRAEGCLMVVGFR